MCISNPFSSGDRRLSGPAHSILCLHYSLLHQKQSINLQDHTLKERREERYPLSLKGY